MVSCFTLLIRMSNPAIDRSTGARKIFALDATNPHLGQATPLWPLLAENRSAGPQKNQMEQVNWRTNFRGSYAGPLRLPSNTWSINSHFTGPVAGPPVSK